MGAETLISRRRAIHFPARPTCFVEPGELDAANDHGRRVFVVGPVPSNRELIARYFPKAGASEIRRLYLDGHYPVIANGSSRATWAGAYFGDGPYTVADAAHVWATIEHELRHAWHTESALLSLTPATTGRDLWLRTIPPAGYPVLPERVQSAIRAGAGQGRIETLPGSGRVTLHEYDARLAYLSLTRRLPVGEPVELDGHQADAWRLAHPYAPARYRVTFTVPGDWSPRPGILPIMLDRTDNPDAGWAWPTAPGIEHGPTWCEGSELALAIREGWAVTVHAVIGWERTADALTVWQGRLLTVLDRAQRQYADNATRSAMVRSAIRAIALHTIGALNGGPHRVTHIGAEPGEGARTIRVLSPGVMQWHTIEPCAWPELSHPEWTATIWGRARARLLDAPTGAGYTGRVGALYARPGSVVAFRTDAIYTSAPTGWELGDDGAPGRYRLKGAHGPIEWPANGLAVLDAKGVAR